MIEVRVLKKGIVLFFIMLLLVGCSKKEKKEEAEAKYNKACYEAFLDFGCSEENAKEIAEKWLELGLGFTRITETNVINQSKVTRVDVVDEKNKKEIDDWIYYTVWLNEDKKLERIQTMSDAVILYPQK